MDDSSWIKSSNSTDCDASQAPDNNDDRWRAGAQDRHVLSLIYSKFIYISYFTLITFIYNSSSSSRPSHLNSQLTTTSRSLRPTCLKPHIQYAFLFVSFYSNSIYLQRSDDDSCCCCNSRTTTMTSRNTTRLDDSKQRVKMTTRDIGRRRWARDRCVSSPSYMYVHFFLL